MVGSILKKAAGFRVPTGQVAPMNRRTSDTAHCLYRFSPDGFR